MSTATTTGAIEGNIERMARYAVTALDKMRATRFNVGWTSTVDVLVS